MAEIQQPVDTIADQAKATRYSWIGGGLIALAFVAPAVATQLGVGNAFSVGQDVFRTLGSLLVIAFIAWLVTRNRSDLAKAKGRVVVGVLLCVVVAGNISGAAREDQEAKVFLREALAMQERNHAKVEAMNKRFETVRVNDYLTPAGLTSRDNLIAARASLEQYKALMAERSLLLQTSMSEAEALIARMPPGRARDGALSTFGPSREKTKGMYERISNAQLAHAAAIEALLDWGQANLGRVSVRNGQFLFQVPTQQSELQSLAQKLDAAEKAVQAAAVEGEAFQANYEETRKRTSKEAEALLSK